MKWKKVIKHIFSEYDHSVVALYNKLYNHNSLQMI